jgi:hypothetical protein
MQYRDAGSVLAIGRRSLTQRRRANDFCFLPWSSYICCRLLWVAEQGVRAG